MLFYKQLNPQGQQKLLQSLSEYTQDILLHDSSKLSYQLAYDQVYQLCRNQKQQKLLETVYTSIRRVLPKAFSQLKPQANNFLFEVSSLIQKTQTNLNTIKDVCLYLDLNYCKRDMNIELISKLNEIFLQEFFNRTQLLEALGKIIAVEHLKDNDSSIKQVLQSIKMIDQQQQFFVNNFVRFYLPTVLQHYTKQSEQKFKKSSTQIQTYILYAYQSLQKQSLFLSTFWPSKRCSQNRSFIIKQLYQILVTKYKQTMYSNHKQKLFNQLTLEILELFKFGIKKQDIEQHADWYNIQIKEKLETFPNDVNSVFIDSICNFYKQIMSLLEKTYNKFDIHYRSRFAFQQWINQQRLQMPLRLNQYIKNFCIGTQTFNSTQQQVLQRIGIIFILMKQKNVFEKHYRRDMINRIVERFGEYDVGREKRIIGLMEKECSEEFVKNIKPILDGYLGSLNGGDKNSKNVNVFMLNTENWPYDQKNTSVAINHNLSKLTQKYTTNFTQTNKDKTLYWHPIIGVVKMSITFTKSNWSGQITVNTCMSNILLYFIKTNGQPFQLKNFCCQTGYKIDQLYDSVRRLIHVKIIANQGNDENYRLSLNQQFSNGNKTFDVLAVDTVNKFESKPLEELKADRKFMVEAIIVKLIKKLKNTSKQTILKEACPLIEKRGFSFNAKFVQSSIDRLIDKEFIRDFQDGTLGYIA